MLKSVTLIFFFQVLGRIIAHITKLPVPGPVWGMTLLLIVFFIYDDLLEVIRPTASVLLANLSLLFVPAGVGLMTHIDRFEQEGIPILLTIILSSIITMIFTVLSIRFCSRLLHLQKKE